MSYPFINAVETFFWWGTYSADHDRGDPEAGWPPLWASWRCRCKPSTAPPTPCAPSSTRPPTLFPGRGRAIVADVSAPDLYRRLLPADAVPASVLSSLTDFVWDLPTVKVNYALAGPIPWRSVSLRGAGTVHLGADADALVRWMADLTAGTVPRHPFMLFGQMSTADPMRSPQGTESAWAYSHLPRGVADDGSARALAAAIDLVVEQHAPGFGDHVIARSEQLPSGLESADANLHAGAVNGGTAALFQQVIFRSLPGFGRPETPVQSLHLGSAAASPGGSVHGICGP